MTKLRIEPDPPTAAQTAVQTFESLAMGQPFADLDKAATEAVGALKAGARTALFPLILPVSADTIALLGFAVETFSRHAFGAQLAVLHQQAIEAAPELAALLRSGPALARVRGMAAAVAPAGGELFAAAEREAVDQYQLAIARQLVGIAEHEPGASILATEVPELEARLEAGRTKHRQHVAAELSRIENEKQAADKVIGDAEQQTRADLAQYFAERHGRGFVVGSHVLSGQAIAAILRHEGARDYNGELAQGFTLAELLEVRVRETAADQAVLGGGVQ